MIRFDMIRYDTRRYDMIRYDTQWYDAIRIVKMQCTTIRYDTIRFDAINNDMIRYDTIHDDSYDSIRCNTILDILDWLYTDAFERCLLARTFSLPVRAFSVKTSFPQYQPSLEPVGCHGCHGGSSRPSRPFSAKWQNFPSVMVFFQPSDQRFDTFVSLWERNKFPSVAVVFASVAVVFRQSTK